MLRMNVDRNARENSVQNSHPRDALATHFTTGQGQEPSDSLSEEDAEHVSAASIGTQNSVAPSKDWSQLHVMLGLTHNAIRSIHDASPIWSGAK